MSNNYRIKVNVLVISNSEKMIHFISDSLSQSKLLDTNITSSNELFYQSSSGDDKHIIVIDTSSIDSPNTNQLTKLSTLHSNASFMILTDEKSEQYEIQPNIFTLALTDLSQVSFLNKLIKVVSKLDYEKNAIRIFDSTYNLIEHAPVPVLLIENELIVYANKMANKLFGMNQFGTLLNENINSLVHPSYKQYFKLWINKLSSSRSSNQPIDIIFQKNDKPVNLSISGSMITQNSTSLIQLYLRVNEANDSISDLLSNFENAENEQSKYNIIKNNISDLINFTAQHKLVLTLSLIEVSDIEFIKTMYGSSDSTQLSNDITDRIKSVISSNDILINLKNSKFALAMVHDTESDKVSSLLTKIFELLNTPYNTTSGKITPRINIGTSIYPSHSLDITHLINYASLSLENAKREKKSSFHVFSNAKAIEINEKAVIINQLKQALINNEFEIYYQPIVNVKHNIITSLEAYIRLRRSNGEIILPNQFLSAAEESGLIIDIGNTAIKLIAQKYNELCKANLPVPISINLSPKQVQSTELIIQLNAIIEEYTLPTNAIQFEFNSSECALNSYTTILSTLNSMNIKLNINNFGSSFFSLRELQKNHISLLKIDRSMIHNIGTSNEADSLVRALIAIAHELNMYISAEGVETADQKEFLIKHNCNTMQGNLISAPLPTNELNHFLHEFQTHTLEIQ